MSVSNHTAAVGGELGVAIRLYEWTSAAAGALFETLGHFEVLLRNALHAQLSAWHTAAGWPGQWYDDPGGVLDARRHTDIAFDRDRIRRECHPAPALLGTPRPARTRGS